MFGVRNLVGQAEEVTLNSPGGGKLIKVSEKEKKLTDLFIFY